jgi:hypothetical protein
MVRMAICWIFINAIFYIGLGLYTIVWPQELASAISFQLNSPGAIAEIKASYGGLMFMLGVIMILLYLKQPISHALGFIALLYLGFGVGRLIGIIGEHAYDRTTLIFSTVEICSFLISVILYYMLASLKN